MPEPSVLIPFTTQIYSNIFFKLCLKKAFSGQICLGISIYTSSSYKLRILITVLNALIRISAEKKSVFWPSFPPNV